MPWSSLASNQTVSFDNLRDAVNNGIFSAKATIPVSSEQITKADANTYVDINTGYAPYANKASNQLVVKSNLQSAISAPYEWTFWYYGCYSGCIDPDARLHGKDGYIVAGDLKIGDEIDSELGYGIVSYIERKTQPKYLVRTPERVIQVSDTHLFIDENGETITTEELKLGTLLNTIDGIEEVTEIKFFGDGEVIEITVEGTHQYYANGFLSHNKACFTYGGWATSSEACLYWGSVSWSLFSTTSTIGVGTRLYSTSTGGANPPFNNSYPYLFSNYLNQWIQVTQVSPAGYFEVLSIGSCSTTTYVTIEPCVPNYMGCYSFYSFIASADYLVDTDVQVEINWTGDLSGFVTGIVTIFSGTNCNATSIYTGGNINCIGEYVSIVNVTLNPSSYGSQIYQVGNVNYGFCPC